MNDDWDKWRDDQVRVVKWIVLICVVVVLAVLLVLPAFAHDAVERILESKP